MKPDDRLSGALQSFYVYYIYAIDDGRLLYIGRSHSPQTRLKNFIRREGVPGRLGMPRRFSTFESAQIAERVAIAKYRPPYNKKVMSAAGMQGHHHSDATRMLIRAAQIDRPKSEVHRTNLSAAMMGKPSPNLGRRMSETQKLKLREAAIGRKHSDAAKAKMSATRSGVSSPLKGRKVGPHKKYRTTP